MPPASPGRNTRSPELALLAPKASAPGGREGLLSRTKLATTVAEVRQWRRGAQDVGLVPTMGNLHEGHLSLVRACRAQCRAAVVSVFVNPTQFGPDEDFDSYPRTLAADLALLEAEGVDLVFAPAAEEVYPPGETAAAVVSVPALASTLCGRERPGHFDGVATVVAKLFNIVAPGRAFFGEKDWQQLAVVRSMARSLDMTVDVVGIPTVRSADGLALSSRNGYLTAGQRQQAAAVNRSLADIAAAIERGERDYAALERQGSSELASAGLDVDYVAIRDAERLTAPDANTKRLRVLAAARLGATRLIDNVDAGFDA